MERRGAGEERGEELPGNRLVRGRARTACVGVRGEPTAAEGTGGICGEEMEGDPRAAPAASGQCVRCGMEVRIQRQAGLRWGHGYALTATGRLRTTMGAVLGQTRVAGQRSSTGHEARSFMMGSRGAAARPRRWPDGCELLTSVWLRRERVYASRRCQKSGKWAQTNRSDPARQFEPNAANLCTPCAAPQAQRMCSGWFCFSVWACAGTTNGRVHVLPMLRR
jgi:hypothetical protein